ncbi:MAG: hypothetical protein ABL876_12580 [Chitinophagaceae bacterium]
MIWLIGIAAFLVLILCWLLIAPLLLEVDTRVPQASFRWRSIGKMRIWYDGDWRLSMQVLFFRKTICLSEMKSKPRPEKVAAPKRKRKKNGKKTMLKMIRVLRTFRVTEWRLAIDTGDYTRNAQLYPMNFLPYAFKHLDINFRDENYLVLQIRNRPWKMIYAFLR